MDVTGAGTAIMIAIAAALWFAYFVPTWMRRREYLDTERTATRLQQTLRVMAETAELPDQVRVEVSARDAARQERLLLAQQRRADAVTERAAERAAAEARAAGPTAAAEARAAAPAAAAGARTRLRRAHRLASLLMIAATITMAVQFWLMAAGTAGSASWLIVAGGAAFGVTGIAVRRRADARGARRAPTAAAPVTAAAAERAEPVRPQRAWTPVPVPAPLYLSRPEPQSVRPDRDLTAQLRAAALLSERALRDAHEAPEVVPFRRPRPTAPDRAAPDRTAAPVESPALRRAAPSRWAAMGRLDGQDAAAPDLDEVLRRRRNAG